MIKGQTPGTHGRGEGGDGREAQVDSMGVLEYSKKKRHKKQGGLDAGTKKYPPL